MSFRFYPIARIHLSRLLTGLTGKLLATRCLVGMHLMTCQLHAMSPHQNLPVVKLGIEHFFSGTKTL